MLTRICYFLRNFFCNDSDKAIDRFSVIDGVLTPPVVLEDGQYYRIVGSVFNDGVHRSDDTLQDEGEFYGGVWKMRVPKDVLDLAIEMQDWEDKYGGLDSTNLSPYVSESFGGYTYTKAQGSGAGGGGSANDVFAAFAGRLAPYRKIRI